MTGLPVWSPMMFSRDVPQPAASSAVAVTAAPLTRASRVRRLGRGRGVGDDGVLIVRTGHLLTERPALILRGNAAPNVGCDY